MAEPKGILIEQGHNYINIANLRLLSHLTYNQEPIFASILEENAYQMIHDHMVQGALIEEIPGSLLKEVIGTAEITLAKKLQIFEIIIHQLELVDMAGFVIFDRHWRNLKVFNLEAEIPSIRQLDIEDLYDRNGDCLYSARNASISYELLDKVYLKGLDLWILSGSQLAIHLKETINQDEFVRADKVVKLLVTYLDKIISFSVLPSESILAELSRIITALLNRVSIVEAEN